MKLSDGERLIVVMLAEMMETNKHHNWEINPALVKTFAINNDDWAIAHKYSGVFASQAPSDDVVKETGDLLWMWGIIEHSLDQLTGSDADHAKTFQWRKFSGFDGNNDDHYGVAHTLINDLEVYQDFKGRDLNSHSRGSLPRYRTMRARFDYYVNSDQAAPLKLEALRDLCA